MARLASLIIFIAAWYFGSALAGDQMLPSPTIVAGAIAAEARSGDLFFHLAVTLTRVLLAFALAMAAGTAAYLIATAPFVPKSTLWWTLPILAANPVFVWLWARATFDDDFVVRRWHGALWLIVVCIGFTVSLNWTTWPTFAGGSPGAASCAFEHAESAKPPTSSAGTIHRLIPCMTFPPVRTFVMAAPAAVR